MATKKPSRLARELAEMAAGQHGLGMMDEETWRQIAACCEPDADGNLMERRPARPRVS
jgi:hypothetical protein